MKLKKIKFSRLLKAHEPVKSRKPEKAPPCRVRSWRCSSGEWPRVCSGIERAEDDKLKRRTEKNEARNDTEIKLNSYGQGRAFDPKHGRRGVHHMPMAALRLSGQGLSTFVTTSQPE